MITGKKQISDSLYDYFAGESLPEGYAEISDLKESIKAANDNQKDYKWTRKFLQQKDWNSLTDSEKTTVAQYRANTEENCKIQLGDTYQYWASEFGLKSKICRELRFENAKTILFRKVDLMSRYTILGFLNSTLLVDNYIKHGIEGTTDGDPLVGLFNFLEGTGDYTTTGLPSMNLTMISGTKEELIIELMQCLRLGNY